MDVVLSLCAGYQERWTFPVAKQLVNIFGEPLLARTIRQMAELGRSTIVISQEPSIRRISKLSMNPIFHRWTVETLLSTEHLWKDRVIVLLGDVIYTNELLRIIINTQQTKFFGSKRELFAFVFTDIKAVRSALLFTIHDAVNLDSRGKLWDFYYIFRNLPKEKHTEPEEGDPMFHIVNDPLVQDFDEVEQYHDFIRGTLGMDNERRREKGV